MAPDPAPARVRPVDPRLVRYAAASRGFFLAIAVIGVAQTAVVVAFAWLLTSAITRVIAGTSSTSNSPARVIFAKSGPRSCRETMR